jgi:cytochrome c oxidase cbb3-type subunit 3
VPRHWQTTGTTADSSAENKFNTPARSVLLSFDEADRTSQGFDRRTIRLVLLGVLGLVALGALAFGLLRRPIGPPPAEIANDPVLVRGREVFLARCVSCHGTSGRGDGPIAKGLSGPPPGDLTDDDWKHGDQPAQVLQIVSQGVKETTMPGWRGTLSEEEVRDVSAYVYYLAGRKVPRELRARSSATGPRDTP